MPESTLDVLIKSKFEGSGVTAAKTEMASLGTATGGATVNFKEHSTAAKEATVAERDIGREATVTARAMGEAGAKGAELTDRFLALGGVMGSSGALGIGLGAAIVGVGGLVEATKSIVEISEAHETSVRDLSQAYQSAGVNLSKYQGSIDAFLDTNARFIADQNVAREGFAEFTRAGLTQNEVMRAMNDSVDLAALKHIDLAEAERQVLLATQGNARGLKDLGIDISALKGSSENAATAQKDLAKANEEVTKKQDAYNRALQEFNDKPTQARAEALARAQQALSKATSDQQIAQDNANHSLDLATQTFDKLEPRLKNGRDATSDLQQQTNLLNKNWDDFANRVGPTMIKSLAEDIGWINQAANAIGNAYQATQNWINALNRAAVSGPAPGAVGARGAGGGTGVNNNITMHISGGNAPGIANAVYQSLTSLLS